MKASICADCSHAIDKNLCRICLWVPEELRSWTAEGLSQAFDGLAFCDWTCRRAFKTKARDVAYALGGRDIPKELEWSAGLYADSQRHLVCVPYSIEGLHLMAKHLGIDRRWFHSRHGRSIGAHYDIPASRMNGISDVRSAVTMLRPRQILAITKGLPRC